MVLFPDEFKVSHSLHKTLLKGKHEVRTDSAFDRSCALRPAAAKGRTALVQEEIIQAYVAPASDGPGALDRNLDG